MDKISKPNQYLPAGYYGRILTGKFSKHLKKDLAEWIKRFSAYDEFTMMQYSVYIRHCASDENAQVHVQRVKNNLPPDGEVRIIKITDKQFARIEVFYGKKLKPTEKPPAQLELF